MGFVEKTYRIISSLTQTFHVAVASSTEQYLCAACGTVWSGRAVISGAVNTFTGGLNAVVGKATGEVFNKSLNLKSVARSIWKSSSNLIKRSARVSRIFGIDSTVKLTIIQRMSTRIFSGRRR